MKNIFDASIAGLPWWAVMIVIVAIILILMIIPSGFYKKLRNKKNGKEEFLAIEEDSKTISSETINRPSDFEKEKPMPKKEKLMWGIFNGYGHKTALRTKSLVYAYPEHDACELCRPFEGKVLSLEELDNEYVTMKEAISKGYHHIGCKHTDLDFYPNETKIPESPWDEKEQIKFHNLVLKMFKIENEIRILAFNLENGNSKNLDYDQRRLTVIRSDLEKFCVDHNLTFTVRRLNPNQKEFNKYQYLPIENEDE